MIDLCKAQCTGCSACLAACPQHCILLVEDEEGFGYPRTNLDNCINCAKCERACPALKQKATSALPINVYAAWAKDGTIKKASSSGGVFTVLASAIISKDGAVFGAAFDDHFEVKHIAVQKLADLQRIQGSKYVQSNVGKTFQDAKEWLDGGHLALFSGTPCQIDGLKGFLGKEYSNLLTCDLVCHGVPSPKVFRAYLKLVSSQNSSKIIGINFRCKLKKWNPPQITVNFMNGRSSSMPLHLAAFGKGFFDNLYLRPSCHACRYASTKREGDITLGDFWGIDPRGEFVDDDTGISLVLANTEKGVALLSTVADQIVSFDRRLKDAVVRENAQLFEPPKANPNRGRFFSDFNRNGFLFASRNYLRPSLKARLIERIPECLLKVYRKFKLILTFTKG